MKSLKFVTVLSSASHIASTFAADIVFKIEKDETKKLYEDTISTLNSCGFNGISFKVDNTIHIHPYKDYAIFYSLLFNDDNSKNDELSFYWYGGYSKYFEYDTNKIISYNYNALKDLKITVKDIKTANIEYQVTNKYKSNNTYINAITEIKNNLFKGKDCGFIILRDHYNAYINWKYPFLSVDYDDKNNKLIVKCDSTEFEKYSDEELYYTIKLKIPEKVINDNKAKNIILQYKKEDLEKIEIKIYSNKNLKLNDIEIKINNDLEKYNIPIYRDLYLFDKDSNRVNSSSVAKGDYTFYSDDLFIKEDYKNKSDELRNQVNKMNSFTSKIHDLEIEKIIDPKEKEKLIKTLFQGIKNIADICNKYSNDTILKDKNYNSSIGYGIMDRHNFKKIINKNFQYLANIYIFLSTIRDVENVTEKIKSNDIDFEFCYDVFGKTRTYPASYFHKSIKKYKDKIVSLFGENLWKNYINVLTENINISKIFWNNEYNKEFNAIYEKKNKLFEDTISDYFNTNYKTIKIKIINVGRFVIPGNYDLKAGVENTKNLNVRQDLISTVTLEFIKENICGIFDSFFDNEQYLFTIYDKDGKYIGYTLDTKIVDSVTLNPSLQCLNDNYITKLNNFNKAKDKFKDNEIKKINEFNGKAADFKNVYKTVLEGAKYLPLSDEMYKMKEKPYYIDTFKKYLTGECAINGESSGTKNRLFYTIHDVNSLIINEINLAAINKYNKLLEAEMAEEDKKILSELKTAVENSKNEISGVINSANDLEKIKNYSTNEKIKAELEKIVKDKVADYDTKKGKFEKIDLFTNPVAEIEKAYKTKENAILEEIRKKEELTKQHPPKNEEEEGKPKEKDNISNTNEVQKTSNGKNSTTEPKPAKQNKKCCYNKKNVQEN